MSVAHLSPSTKLDNALYISGQLPFTAEGALPDGIAAQTRQVILNLQSILEREGLDLSSVVKTGVFLVRPEDFKQFSVTYAELFGAYRLACCRFGGHRDRMFPPIGGPRCNEGSSAASSSLRR